MDATVFVRKLPHARRLPLPCYMTAEAAGLDLQAANEQPVIILPGRRALIPTGLQLAVPAGYEAQVRPRSGLALRQGICVLNSPGTIDADYRGEVKVILANFGKEPFIILPGDRIAQLVVAQVARAEIRECRELPSTDRGGGGFGHTGV
jgi:dUTP pyrophosphatase